MIGLWLKYIFRSNGADANARINSIAAKSTNGKKWVEWIRKNMDPLSLTLAQIKTLTLFYHCNLDWLADKQDRYWMFGRAMIWWRPFGIFYGHNWHSDTNSFFFINFSKQASKNIKSPDSQLGNNTSIWERANILNVFVFFQKLKMFLRDRPITEILFWKQKKATRHHSIKTSSNTMA